MKLRYW